MIFKIAFGKEIHILNKKVDYHGLVAFIRASFKKLPNHWALSYADAEGDKIAIENQSDIDILCENTQVKSIKISIEVVEENELILRSESDRDEIPEIIEEKKEVSEVMSQSSKLNASFVSQPELEQMVRSKIQEMFPEITKKVSQELQEMSKSSIRQEKTESTIPSTEAYKPSSAVIHHGVACDNCGIKPIIGIRYKSLIQHNYDFCEKCEASVDHPHAFIKIRRPEQAPKVLVASMEDNEKPGVDVNGHFFSTENVGNLLNSFIPSFGRECPRRSWGMWKNKAECEAKPKTETPKPEVPKTEAPVAPKVEVPVVEPKKEEASKKEEKREEFCSAEERNLVMATYLESIFEEKLDRLLKFAARFPLMNREQLAEKWVELHYK